MSIRDAKIEWFDDKFDCNCPEKNLQEVSFSRFSFRDDEEPIERICFSLGSFDKHLRGSQYAMLGFDRKLGLMAIKPIAEEDEIPGSYKICFTNNQNAYGMFYRWTSWNIKGIAFVTPTEFLIEFDLKHSEYTTYDAEFDKDKQILFVAIDKDKLVKNIS